VAADRALIPALADQAGVPISFPGGAERKRSGLGFGMAGGQRDPSGACRAIEGRGVEIRLHTKDQGLDLNVAASGVGISWAEKAK